MHDEAAGDIMMLWYYPVGVFEQPQLKVRIELEYHFNFTSHHRALAPGARHSGSKIPATVLALRSCFAEFGLPSAVPDFGLAAPSDWPYALGRC